MLCLTTVVILLETIVFAKTEGLTEKNAHDQVTTFGYLKSIGIPTAEIIRAAEERFPNTNSRIVGGMEAALGQNPWQAGLIIDIIGQEGRAICGASLISPNRLVTAAHCWFDGVHNAWRLTVVLGSVQLFNGGTRIETSVVAVHPKWLPLLVRNDVAVVYLPMNVAVSDTIAPVSLPSGSEIDESFAGELAIASGFGLTSDEYNITTGQNLSHVRLTVMSNKSCRLFFPFVLQPGNICTSGLGGVGTCRGDSGGPLVVKKGDKNILIGITSFGLAFGCQLNYPAVYTRVTTFVSFINEHL